MPPSRPRLQGSHPPRRPPAGCLRLARLGPESPSILLHTRQMQEGSHQRLAEPIPKEGSALSCIKPLTFHFVVFLFACDIRPWIRSMFAPAEHAHAHAHAHPMPADQSVPSSPAVLQGSFPRLARLARLELASSSPPFHQLQPHAHFRVRRVGLPPSQASRPARQPRSARLHGHALRSGAVGLLWNPQAVWSRDVMTMTAPTCLCLFFPIGRVADHREGWIRLMCCGKA